MQPLVGVLARHGLLRWGFTGFQGRDHVLVASVSPSPCCPTLPLLLLPAAGLDMEENARTAATIKNGFESKLDRLLPLPCVHVF